MKKFMFLTLTFALGLVIGAGHSFNTAENNPPLPNGIISTTNTLT